MQRDTARAMQRVVGDAEHASRHNKPFLLRHTIAFFFDSTKETEREK